MSKKDQAFAQRVVDLAFEFNRYVIEHPEVTEKIGREARIFFQIERDEEFNAWSRQFAESQQPGDRPVVWIKIKKLRPIQSRIEVLELVTV
ncbi:hypothetical protein LM602_06300 [Candidatus Acetothermia bacterium]|jgi:hypothetical protein|nr:hypothetical protein [Candidatus Acetothermia bacterium]